MPNINLDGSEGEITSVFDTEPDGTADEGTLQSNATNIPPVELAGINQ